MLAWLKDNGPVVGALAGVLVAFVAVLQLVVAGPMNSRFDDLRSEMNERFGEFRSEMNERFGELRSDMNQRFDLMNKYMNARFDAVDQGFDAVDQRLEAVEQRLGRLETDVSELRALSDRVSRNEGRIDQLAEQLQAAPTPDP